MNPQTSPTPQSGGERPNPVVIDQATGMPEQVVIMPAETAPAVPTDAPVISATPQLSASDVAAAISQLPTTTPSPAPIGAASAAPATALEQDVIEPEWVDQAEAVIQKTAGDPHAEEEAVEALQIDYLQKRYGHSVKKPDQGAS